MAKFKKAKKVIALALAAAMTFSVAACGDKEEATTAATTEAAQTSGDADTVVAEGDKIGTTIDPNTPFFDPETAPEEAVPLTDGLEIVNITFDDSVDGFVSYINSGGYELKQEDGMLVMDIEKCGILDYANQAYFDGFMLNHGCVYTYSFDMKADIERPIQYRLQINGGDYHAYCGDDITIGTEMQTYTVDFTMEGDSDPAPRIVFNCGIFDSMGGDPGPHKIYIDNIHLFVKDATNAEKIETLPLNPVIAVSQIGYRPNDPKWTTVANDNADEVLVVNAADNTVVYQAPLGEGFYDMGSTTVVKQADFSAVTTPGTYYLYSVVKGNPYRSYDFQIGDGIYNDIYKDTVLMLYKQRCGMELDKNICGDFAHPACHTQIAKVYGGSGEKDVSGGWHDAGDYGRYVVSGAKAVKDLFLAYEIYGMADDDLGIPESGNGVADILDEARYEVEWMLKMQDEATGGVYHKVSGLMFPETVMPEDETADMYLAPISTAATGDFAAIMAEASVLYKDIDAEFAAKCLEAAKKAYEYTKVSTDDLGYKNPEEIVTGEYPDKITDDEKFWAAVELYIATGEDTYKEDVNKIFSGRVKVELGWAAMGGYGIYDLLRKCDSSVGDAYDKSKQALLDQADYMMDKASEDGYHMSLISSYPWGSNMTVSNNGMILLMASAVSGDDKYMTLAKQQLDYILGSNSLGYCFVTGYGKVSPDSTHHRPSQVLEKTMVGMLVGGPDSNLEDSYAKAVLNKCAPAKCYADNSQSYSCNEICIYWNSPLIVLLSAFK